MTEYPSIGLCQEYCFRLHYNVYALKATECHCLQNDFTAVPLPSNQCNGGCSNEEDDILSNECGGEGAFNVFSTETGTDLKDVGKTCMALQCNKENARFVMCDCAEELGIICNFSEIHTDQRSWKDSFQICKSTIRSNPTKKFNLSNTEEACKIINMTSEALLWIDIVREKYVSEDQGESILNRKIITKCKKCRVSHCEFETCSKKIANEVQCTAVSSPVYPHKESSKDDIVYIGSVLATVIIGSFIGAVIFLILVCYKRKRKSPGAQGREIEQTNNEDAYCRIETNSTENNKHAYLRIQFQQQNSEPQTLPIQSAKMQNVTVRLESKETRGNDEDRKCFNADLTADYEHSYISVI